VIKLASLDEATRIDEIVTILTTLTPVDTAIAA
jgi:hypothetical protein